MRGSRGAAPLDRGQAVLTGVRSGFLFAALAVAIFAAACSHAPGSGADDGISPEASDIKALRWLAGNADKIRSLTELPAACETPPSSRQQATQRLRGKIAFESPALLGGAAARMELACASCHRNGRGNPDFFLEGVSGEPGTADVTSSVLSKVRGDGAFNPVAIPDIAMRDGRQLVDRTGPAFREKVRGLIEEEFDGQRPPPFVTDALIAYLDGLSPTACSTIPEGKPMRLIDDVDAAAAAWDAAVDPGLDAETRIFYLRVARLRLARIYERLVGPDFAQQRSELLALSAALGEMADAVRTRADAAFVAPDWDGFGARLGRVEAGSLYNPEVLRIALAPE